MKKISTYLFVVVLSLLTFSCSEDDNFMMVAPEGSFSILSTAPSSPITLKVENEANLGYTLVWNEATYTAATPITYHIQASRTSDFAAHVSAGNTTATYKSWTQAELNQVALDLGLTPLTSGTIYLRVQSSIGTPATEFQYSDVLSLSVIPYTTELPKIAVPGNHQGWSPATAPLLASPGFGQTNYEGFVWLDGEFKFIAPDASGNFAWGNTDWGDDGSFSGVLVATGEVNGTATAGYYYVKANTGTLTYSTTLTNWGVIGSATPGGWDNSTAMTYNASTKKWSVTVALSGGNELKFRANNAWDINLGADGTDDDESMDFGGNNIAVATGGTYLVELDLSNPRNYKYTLTLQ
ncbi:MAG: SusF/SusE family outer membrane protein [Chryseobacterium sp.]|nr:MAG: SusF/SusE family outer membrane protein [Chryseobacterium sp.]